VVHATQEEDVLDRYLPVCLSVCSYLLLLTQYEAVSFCDVMFAGYVLLPLQQRHSVLLRKAVWGEHVSLLHCLSIPPSQVRIGVFFIVNENCFFD